MANEGLGFIMGSLNLLNFKSLWVPPRLRLLKVNQGRNPGQVVTRFRVRVRGYGSSHTGTVLKGVLLRPALSGQH